ncbi:Isopropylmalate/citramalate isomerase large subunit [Thermoplasmatales archaeon]|nr:Isopropylmalate/citramalate isomerase large subunit [Thermoplasmatales archaeon]
MSMESKFRIEKTFEAGGKTYHYFSLPELDKAGHAVSKLPLSIRIVLESLIRNLDGKSVREEDVKNLLNWDPMNPPEVEIPFKVARVIMQDFTGVPAIVDLASMREKAKELGKNPEIIQPQIPVDLVIDHSVQVDFYGDDESLARNREKEFQRNSERYRFLKWAQKSFKNLKIVPPSVGIVHQVNLEYLARVVMSSTSGSKIYAYPDTLVGTDSHTTMINGLGVVGWGVGGIEAEAAMLDQPVTILAPKVVGVNVHGKLRTGINATDAVLTLTELLRKHNVVGKFVEFYGDGISQLPLPDRATLSNMCPEYGATLALFPVDEETLNYLRMTGRPEDQVQMIRKYLQEQGFFGTQKGMQFSEIIDLDLSRVETSVSGPKLPQQRSNLRDIGRSFMQFMEQASGTPAGKASQHEVYLKSAKISLKGKETTISDGDVVIAAITSCTNTSNPRVMVGAGLLAKNAVEKGLTVNPKVKTSLAPGSRVVSEYLDRSGLQAYLDELGFYLVGFGCTTCIGNSGPLDPAIESAITGSSLSTAAVLSGNRNFEARIHKSVRANYLMSPPLVVALAIAGKITIDPEKEPLGNGRDGKPVFLKDIWPDESEITKVIQDTIKPGMFIEKYSNLDSYNEDWVKIDVPGSMIYPWDGNSTYIRNPPFFDSFVPGKKAAFGDIRNALPLLVLGDSVTTDHISPAGSISRDSPAGKYLIEHGIDPADFNSFGSRRGNHEVMMRGTFGNNRIRNLMVNSEGGYTMHVPSSTDGTVYDVAMKYAGEKRDLIVFAGKEYGTGSSRDWAAKGTYLLGVRAVIAKSYERIHRSNLIGMGVIPLEFQDGKGFENLNADISRGFDLVFPQHLTPSCKASLSFTTKEGRKERIELLARLDTPIEVEYFQMGGILQYVMDRIMS